ncbi:MAG: arylsulfatase A-like enzyme [Verrucomicrobiales bacterium]|jgi:arylsulfatase A-like enzyme
MKLKSLILALGFAPLLSFSADSPNLIYIMVDDLGYGDLGCFGQEEIQTPNLDRMAEEGMRLTSFYAGCTVCRPSRLSLWTGKHMGHTPIWSNATYHFKPEDVTVGEQLQAAGYVTGGVGKWAMGGVDTTGFPLKNGFDFWMGYLDQGAAHNFYPTHLWRNAEQFSMPGNVLSDHKDARGRVSKERETYSHDVMTEQAFGFIRENAEKPFLLHIHWTIPHANNEGGRVTGDGMEVPDYGIYADREQWPSTAKGQAAMITRMDGDVGRLLKLLKELGLDERTLVFFTSDNGPHSEGGHKHEFFDANGPLRGFKRDLYEGGIRVPAIARWPGAIKAGSKSDEPFAFWDWMSTACELTGAKTPEGIDGISFAPTLRGEKQKERHAYLYWRYGKKEAVRRGDWKAVRLGPDKPTELYDLEIDIGEAIDIASFHPGVVKEFEALMADAVAAQ